MKIPAELLGRVIKIALGGAPSEADCEASAFLVLVDERHQLVTAAHVLK